MSIKDDDSRLFGYARVSRDDKGKVLRSIPEGFEMPKDPHDASIRWQQTLLNEWAKKIGKPLVFGFDQGISAADVSYVDRPGFQALVQQMRPGDHLGVWKTDRIERGHGRMTAAVNWLKDKKGVTVHKTSTGTYYDMDKLSDKIILTVEELVAMIHIEDLRQGIIQGLNHVRSVGLRHCKYPGYGRRFEERTSTGPDGKPQTITHVVWDTAQCDIIREIIRRRDDNQEPWYDIAKDLHKRQGGLPAPDGGEWLHRTPTHISKGERGTPQKVSRVYRWYKLVLRHGMNLGDEGVPTGLAAMTKKYGVEKVDITPVDKRPRKRMTAAERQPAKRAVEPPYVCPDLSEWTEPTLLKERG